MSVDRRATRRVAPKEGIEAKRARKKAAPRKKTRATRRGVARNDDGKVNGAAAQSAPAAASDYVPFDRRFFEAQFPNLFRRKGKRAAPSASSPDVVINVVLGDGSVALDVSHVENTSDSWILFGVYEGAPLGPGGAASPARFVFVPYPSIARVEVTGIESRIRSIGFEVRRPPVSPTGRRRRPTAR